MNISKNTVCRIGKMYMQDKQKITVIDVYNKRVLDGTACGTITANGNTSSTHCGTFGIIQKGEDEMAKVGQISNEGSQCGSVYSDNGNSPTLTAGTHGDANSKICTEYRIRKLTPKECWRLMSFRDEDFYKAEKMNSNTQLYRQAGNSICVNVLMAIFSQLNLSGHKTWNEMSEKERRELVAKCRDYD